MTEELERALRDVRDKLLSNPVSPRVEDSEDINMHYCRHVAETVADRVGEQYDLQLLEDGGRGFAHTWLAVDGRHYDAECIEGVDDYTLLPFFRRHPEAAVRVEDGTTAHDDVRRRGLAPLYPDL